MTAIGFAGFLAAFFLPRHSTLDVAPVHRGAMVIVFVVIPPMGPRTPRPRLEAILR
ncbi:MAG: hypothetical protein ACREEZ_13260 [Stellaceae bacterium]